MTKEQFDREVYFGARKNIVERMLRQGLITEREFRQLCTKYERTYRPIIGGFIGMKKP
jgi:hypothetical protein